MREFYKTFRLLSKLLKVETELTDIFFDLDHTLWDFDKNSHLAFEKIFKSQHPTIVTGTFLQKYIPINHACWKQFQVDAISHDELRYQRLKQSFDAIGYTISDTQIEQIAVDYIQFLPDFNHLFEDAIPTLTYLERKYNLHIITNGFAEVQFKKINNSNLASFFKSVTNSEMAGAKKPNPIIFEYAVALAETHKSKSLMIGDCLDADVNGAQDFGMKAIFFNPNKIEVPETITQITTLAQLQTLL